jgi:hypothetical protein
MLGNVLIFVNKLSTCIDAMIVRCGRGQPFHQAPEVLGEADRWSASIT